MMKSNLLFAFFLLLLISCNSENPNYNLSEAIRLNQLGYYPNSTKQFILSDEIGATFKIVDIDGNLKYQGNLIENGIWEASGENVLLGDFSAFSEVGIYKVVIDEKWQSFEFEIKKHLYAEPLKAAVKSYYFQRASISIEEAYGGQYQKAAGHLDNECTVHPSTGHDSGTWNGSGGWYDAGDYGKYIGNAALSTGQMLVLAENFPNLLEDDFYWAATELFLATGEKKYLEHIQNSTIEYKHVLHDSWKNFVRNTAFHSALFNAEKLPVGISSTLKEGHLNLANEVLKEINTHAYRIGLNDFVWGSNSDILNQAYILCVAHYLTKDE